MSLAVSRHRRSRRGAWIAVLAGVVGIALVAGGAVAYARWSSSPCDSTVTLTVAASPDQFPVMSRSAEQWNQTDPQAGGACVEVAVEAAPSAFVAGTLSPEWDEERDGSRPDVWVPDSSTWLAVASARPEAAGMLPAEPPSLASSPVVLAMQRPMAEALGWPEEPLGWSTLLGAFSRGQTWEQFGHPEWGRLHLGISDPTRSTAGQAGVVTMLDLDGDGVLSDQEVLGGTALVQLLQTQAEDTEALLRAYQGAGEDPAALPAGFPVLERDLAGYAAEDPEVPLVPVYPVEGVIAADYPYTVLDAPWMDAGREQAAADFLEYLQGPDGRQAYTEAGFRDPAQSAEGVTLLSSAAGFADPVPVPVRQPLPEELSEVLGAWPTMVRPGNVLIAVDISGSMNGEVPGTDQTRLQLLQAAATEGIGLLNNETTLGLWEFSSELTATTPYRELVPMGPVGEDLGEGTRREAMLAGVQSLTAEGATGLYDTIHDGYLEMQQRWQPDAINMFVLITDGKDEFHDGRTLEQLLTELGEAVQPDRPLPIIAMAVGPEADAAALEQITEVTGGRTIIARDDVSAIQQVVLAFAGRIS